MSGIYIHIPFCKQACSYCDFYFVTRDRLIPSFVDTLIQEVSTVASLYPKARSILTDPLKTLYLGGGTPSRLNSEQLYRLVEALRRRFNLNHLQEFTVEVNPEDLTRQWLKDLKRLGVTRLSVGIQSFQPELLSFMHRAHSAAQAHHALEMITDTGFDSFSVDLIYGNPDQTDRQLEDDLRQLLHYQPPHVSAYALTIEPQTRLGKQHQLGRLTPAEDDLVAEQGRIIMETLADAEIYSYEVSNYARSGHEAVHNSAYWRHENYLGLGTAAHSFFWLPEKHAAVRWQQPRDIHSWQQRVTSPANAQDHIVTETLGRTTLAGERVMLGLRTRAGISREELAARYRYTLTGDQEKTVALLREKELMEPEEPLRLTPDGMAVADAVTRQLL